MLEHRNSRTIDDAIERAHLERARALRRIWSRMIGGPRP